MMIIGIYDPEWGRTDSRPIQIVNLLIVDRISFPLDLHFENHFILTQFIPQRAKSSPEWLGSNSQIQ